MEESIKLIGERLRGLRDVLDIPAEEVAELCGITLEHYLKIEAGEADPSVYRLRFQNAMAFHLTCCFLEKSRA